MAVSLDAFMSVVAGSALCALAAAVFLARPGSRMNRSFALLVLCQGLSMLLFGIDGRVDSLAGQLRPYALIAIPFAATYVGLQLLACYRATPLRRLHPNIAFGVLLVGGAIAEGLYFMDHALFFPPTGDGGYGRGPLTWFIELSFLTPALLGLLFAFALRNSRLGLSRRSLWQAMLGFLVVPAYVATWKVVVDLLVAAESGSLYSVQSTVSFAATVAVVAASVAMLARRDLRLEATRAALALGLVAGSGLVTGVVVAEGAGRDPYGVHFFVYGTWSLAAAALLATPVLRDRILDVDYRVNWTFRKGAAVSVMVAVAIAVIEALSNWLSDRFSILVGSATLGLLLLAMQPLQRVTDRAVNHAIPPAPRLENMDDRQRRLLYGEQAAIAWSNGSLNRKERLLLDALRERLGIAPHEAARIESSLLGA